MFFAVFCLVVAAAVQGEQLSYEQRDDIGIALKMDYDSSYFSRLAEEALEGKLGDPSTHTVMEYEGDNAKKLVEEAVNAWKDKTRNISPGTSFGCSTAKKDGKHKIVCVFE